MKLEDLQAGMELQGTVRNVVDFGAFVDCGIKEAGFVHISKMSESLHQTSARGRHRSAKSSRFGSSASISRANVFN
ncbi:MAG: S1 RNA-binding domain-containing protein [Bacillus subtilis]|nr:S1 RNA-binding domain-containing protein [Bacillus subtilis]